MVRKETCLCVRKYKERGGNGKMESEFQGREWGKGDKIK